MTHRQKIILSGGKLFWQVWSPPDNPIQSERAKHVNSWYQKKNEKRREILFIDSQIQSPKSGNDFIVPLNFDADWSSPDNPARYLSAKGRLKPSVNKYVKCLTYFQNKITIGEVSGCTVWVATNRGEAAHVDFSSAGCSRFIINIIIIIMCL